jgi:hypothetical protein
MGYYLPFHFDADHSHYDAADLLKRFQEAGCELFYDDDLPDEASPTIVVSGLPGAIWLSESGEQIQAGIWAYARFSWSTSNTDLTSGLEKLLSLADRLSFRISDGSAFLDTTNLERFVGSFQKSASIVANLLTPCQ